MVLNMFKVFGIKGNEGQERSIQSQARPLPPPPRVETKPPSPSVSSPRLSFLRARGRFAAAEDVLTSAPPLPNPASARIPASPPAFRKPPLTRSTHQATTKNDIPTFTRKGSMGRTPLPPLQSGSPPVSLSAPPSPGSSRTSGLKSPIFQRSSYSAQQKGLPPRPNYTQPMANICVEKGRIHFKNDVEKDPKTIKNEYERIDADFKYESVRVSKITLPKVEAKLSARVLDSGYGESPISPPLSPNMPRFIMPERRGDKSYSASSTPILPRRADFVRSVSNCYDTDRFQFEVERKRLELSANASCHRRNEEFFELPAEISHRPTEEANRKLPRHLERTAVLDEPTKVVLLTDNLSALCHRGNDEWKDLLNQPSKKSHQRVNNGKCGLIEPSSGGLKPESRSTIDKTNRLGEKRAYPVAPKLTPKLINRSYPDELNKKAVDHEMTLGQTEHARNVSEHIKTAKAPTEINAKIDNSTARVGSIEPKNAQKEIDNANEFAQTGELKKVTNSASSVNQEKRINCDSSATSKRHRYHSSDSGSSTIDPSPLVRICDVRKSVGLTKNIVDTASLKDISRPSMTASLPNNAGTARATGRKLPTECKLSVNDSGDNDSNSKLRSTCTVTHASCDESSALPSADVDGTFALKRKPTNAPPGPDPVPRADLKTHESKINVPIQKTPLCELSRKPDNYLGTKDRSLSPRATVGHVSIEVEVGGEEERKEGESHEKERSHLQSLDFLDCKDKSRGKTVEEEPEDRRIDSQSDLRVGSGSSESQNLLHAAQYLPVLRWMATESCQKRLTHLQLEVGRMEEMMRSVLPPCKATMDFLCIEKAALTKAYERRLHDAHGRIARLELENRTLHAKLHHSVDQSEEDGTGCSDFLELFQQLRADNEALVAESEQQRRQYERCLDDVATNVVQAVMAQKSVQTECQRLQRRMKELEQHNAVLGLALRRQLQATGAEPENSTLDALLRMATNQKELELAGQKVTSSWDGSTLSPSLMRDSVCSTVSEGELSSDRTRECDGNWSLRPNRLHLSHVTGNQPIIARVETKTILRAQTIEQDCRSLGQDCRAIKTEVGKDEGYSTMSSDGQGDLKESDIRTCSPLPLRKQLATRSLPARRKVEKPSLPNRSLSLQETLREVKEVSESSDNSDSESPANFRKKYLKFSIKDTVVIKGGGRKYRKRQKKFRHSYHYETVRSIVSPLRRTHSDSEMTCHGQKITILEESLSSLDLSKCQRIANPHPLRRSKAHTELIENCDMTSPKSDDSCLSGFSSDCDLSKSLCEERSEEVQSWGGSAEDLRRDTSKLNLPSIRENSVELEEDSSECAWNSPTYGQTSMPNADWPFKSTSFQWETKASCDLLSACCSECSSIDCNVVDFPSKRSSVVGKVGLSDLESPLDDSKIDTEFTRDFYRLVKFESSRSLAMSSRSLDQDELPPPDQKVALQSVLDFIAEQQMYCTSRENLDEQVVCSKSVQVSDSPTLAVPPHKNSCTFEELKRFIDCEESPSGHEGDSDSDSGFTTGWVHLHRKAELMDKQLRNTVFSKMMVTSSSSDCLSSCCDSCPSATVSPAAPTPPSVEVKKRGIPRLIRGKLFSSATPASRSHILRPPPTTSKTSPTPKADVTQPQYSCNRSQNLPNQTETQRRYNSLNSQKQMSGNRSIAQPQYKCPQPQGSDSQSKSLVQMVGPSCETNVRRKENLAREVAPRASWATTIDSEMDTISISDSCMGSMASSAEFL